MTVKERIYNAIYSAIDDVNEVSPENQQLDRVNSTILFGSEGKLDSLGLVNLIVVIEEKIQDEFDRFITLADERAMSQRNSPFKSVESLANYINEILNEKQDA